MRLVHRFFSLLGLSLGGHKACLKHGCEEYCGYSPSESFSFMFAKLDEDSPHKF